MGNRKRPFYRVVAAEEANRRDGRFIEILGTYDPLRQPAVVEIQSEAVLKWLSQGAQPTDTVRRILSQSGVWAHWQASKAGGAELSEMTGRVSGTLQSGRSDRPSKKTVAKIAEETAKQAEEAAAAATAAEEASKAAAEAATEEAPADETAS